MTVSSRKNHNINITIYKNLYTVNIKIADIEIIIVNIIQTI